jgi:hypothetical protein
MGVKPKILTRNSFPWCYGKDGEVTKRHLSGEEETDVDVSAMMYLTHITWFLTYFPYFGKLKK